MGVKPQLQWERQHTQQTDQQGLDTDHTDNVLDWITEINYNGTKEVQYGYN